MLAREHAPDLILIDLNLPELDGVEAAGRILAKRSVPIVALTGYANTGAVDRGVAAGAVGTSPSRSARGGWSGSTAPRPAGASTQLPRSITTRCAS